MHLDEPTCPAACAIRAVELKHPTSTTVDTDCVFHRLILFYRRFCKLLSKHKYIGDYRRRGLEQIYDYLFAKCVGLHAVVGKPLLHLLHRVRIIELGNVLHSGSELVAGATVYFDGFLYQRYIQRNTSVVYLLVEVILVPYGLRHWKLGKPRLYRHFCLNIANVIFFER